MFETVIDEARHWRVRYPKGRTIYEEGESSSAIFRVQSGCVRLQVNGDDGGRRILAFLFPGDHFGVCVGERTSSAEAVTEVELTRYSLQSVLELSQGSTEIVLELVRLANERFRDLAHHLENITQLAAADRVLWFLSWLSRRQGRVEGGLVHLPMSRREIGDFLALSPETMSRVISDLQAQGALQVKGRRALVLRRSFSDTGSYDRRPRAAGSDPVLGRGRGLTPVDLTTESTI